MIRSQNEIAAIVRQAARGAGAPPGQAEDLARTALYLVQTREGLDRVAAALLDPFDPVDVQWDRDCIKVRSGPAMMTAPVVRDAFLGGVDSARLDHPAHAPLIRAALAEAGIMVAGDDTDLARISATPPAGTVTGPVDVPNTIWSVFATFAARTFVPETDASRITGAGAGLTDND